MGKHEKLATRIKSRPKDFTFQELTALLAGFGYTLDQGGRGSRVRFDHPTLPPVCMHKPHPSPVLKPYQVEQVLELLKQEGLL